ncbi:MAG: 7-cyano-7-deazaguanine synthase QueC [Candidatus Glassbacteria bacterium]|nr:7-cyano-7-deazaguanine synthase QueC [Candidatus Glassbacteria bacterium]
MASNADRAVVCVSGGMDSCVCAALALKRHGRVYFLHADYGQRTEEVERECFRRLADHYGVRDRLVCRLEHLGSIGGSSLTDTSIAVSESGPDPGVIPSSYVPFRNAHFLSAAVSWAEVVGAGTVYIGAVEQDSSGYPDCRREYYEAFQRLVELGTRPETGIRISTPLIALRKHEVVEMGLSLGAPFELTWSCYRSSGPACGRCDSCVLRLRAFAEAGVDDPLEYES